MRRNEGAKINAGCADESVRILRAEYKMKTPWRDVDHLFVRWYAENPG